MDVDQEMKMKSRDAIVDLYLSYGYSEEHAYFLAAREFQQKKQLAKYKKIPLNYIGAYI